MVVAPTIRTSALRKVFPGKREVVAVDGIDLEVSEGAFFGLLGPNGAGKSTTIGMLTTRVDPTSGTAEITGVDVRKHPAEAKRRLGVVSQTNTLDRSLTVAENLEFHGRYFGMRKAEARARSAELLETFQLTDRAQTSVMALSGGLAQRLMVARALVHRPAVLFLDEPTTGIDPQSRLNLWSLLRGLHDQGQTILLTTHYMDEADALCERIAVVDHGKVLADDTPAALKASYGSDTALSLTVGGGDLEGLRAHAAGVEGVTAADIDGDRLRVAASRSEGLLADLVAAAAARGVVVHDATSQPPSLESVFLALTGRDLRE
jgi:daunorubicin resistance ABC transporter ATP-binding subunit